MEERKILDSWKEISSYLKRSVSTCHRWEEELGLPVHRLDGTPRARVFAYTDELDGWKAEKLNHAEALEKEIEISRRLKNKWWLISAGAIPTLAIIAILVWPHLFPGPIPVPLNNPILAILPFENLTGDEVLESWRTAFSELLITDLRQSRYVNVAPAARILSTLDGLKLGEAKKFSAEDLTKIEDRLGADFMATGSLIRSGEDIIVNVFVKNTKTKEAAKSLRANVRGEQGLLDKADALTKEIKSALSLTPRQIACDMDESVRRIATKSPQAFKLYSQAWRRFTSEPFSDTVGRLQKAIDLDPRFGLAYRELYRVYRDTRIDDMIKSYQKALDFSDRMSERERLLLQAEFYQFYRSQSGYSKLAGADIPASTLAKLGPKDTGEAMDVLERLGSLYPDFFGDLSYLMNLSTIYTEREEWDKAISVLEKAMTTEQGKRQLSQRLLDCYRAKRQFDKAEKVLDDMVLANSKGRWDSIRHNLALDQKRFDEALGYLKKGFAGLGLKTLPYSYFSSAGYIDWLRDDMPSAEKAYRTFVDPTNPNDEYQRAVDLAALCLTQGKISQGMDHSKKGLELSKNIKQFAAMGRPRYFHRIIALFHRLAGRLPEALKEVEEACRDCKSPSVSPRGTIESLHLRALLNLEMNRLDEFEKQAEEIKQFIEQERYPKLMRAYYHLLGLRELRQNHANKAVEYLSKAVDLSTPWNRDAYRTMCLYSLAEAYEKLGKPVDALMSYDEITQNSAKESWSGDIYAKSFYKRAKLNKERPRPYLSRSERIKIIESYKKFLSLWGDADSIFPEVEDARKRLAKLQSQD
jgi:tetratricopeptide (TPR) repeat protein